MKKKTNCMRNPSKKHQHFHEFSFLKSLKIHFTVSDLSDLLDQILSDLMISLVCLILGKKKTCSSPAQDKNFHVTY